MISGATRGAGGAALGRHLTNAQNNEQVLHLEGRGLLSDNIRDQVAELTALGAHARTRTPLYHVHADPPADRPWTPIERADYWDRFEREFGLEGRPFAAVEHVKDGRAHEHRVYLRVQPDGTAIRLDHDHARREKINRVFEFQRGETLTPGAHNRAVIQALTRSGREEIANAMTAAGLHQNARPRAALTPAERMQAERTGVDPKMVQAAALAAWRNSDGAHAFASALAEKGLRLARGEKATVIVDSAGGVHSLARALGKESKIHGDRITAGDVANRISGLSLPNVDVVQQMPAIAVAAPQAVAISEPVAAQKETPVTSSPITTTTKIEAPESERETTTARVTANSQNLSGGSSASPVQPHDVSAPVSAGTGTETIDGPGEPPGHGATFAEVSAYRDRLYRYQQQKDRAATAAAAALNAPAESAAPTNNTGAQSHVYVPQKHAYAETQDLVGRPYQRPDFGHDARRQDTVSSKIERLARDGSDHFRSAQHSQESRLVDGAPQSSRTAAESRADTARPSDDTLRSNRPESDPDRSAYARHRVQARRTLVGLAAVAGSRTTKLASLIEGLRQPPTAEKLIAKALAHSANRAARVLESEPWKDPKTRDAAHIAGILHEEKMQSVRESDRCADKARAAADAAKKGVGIVGKIAGLVGIQTRAVRAADIADTIAVRADVGRVGGRQLDRDLALVDSRAAVVVRERESERSTWAKRPEIAAALNQKHGDRLVRQAIAGGDTRLAAVAMTDLPAARDQALKRDAEQQRRIQAIKQRASPGALTQEERQIVEPPSLRQ